MRPELPTVDADGLLEELDLLYREQVRATAFKFALGVTGKAHGCDCGPVLFTLERRRNFCRSGFSLAAGASIGDIEAGRLSAAAGEVAWTCALLLDDLVDGAEEREGHPCAHLVYGRVRTAAAACGALSAVAAKGFASGRVPLRLRLAMERFGLELLWRCGATQVPGRSRSADIASYEHQARDLNNSMHWALMAPLLGRADKPLLRAAGLFADATSVNGKLRNDLLDYYGGSTESHTLFGDFEQRLVTFPVLVLLEQDLSPADRRLVEEHFFENGRSLSPDDFVGFLEKYGATEKCLDLMWAKVDMALEAVSAIRKVCGATSWLADLTLRWTSYVISYAEARIHLRAAEMSSR